jgi:hypothetical protein
MSNDIAKKQPLELDSIDDFDDSITGGDGGGRSGGGFLPDGMRIKFTKTERWEDNNGTDITGKVLVHLDTLRTEVHWGKDGKPIAPPRILGPGEQYRDVDAINEAIDKSEWLPGFEKGKLRGPVQNQNVVVLGNLATMERFVWPSPVTTIGSAIAVRELNTQVQRMRAYHKGRRVYAKIELATCVFPTSYGPRQRPRLQILGFCEPTEQGLAEIDPNLRLSSPPTAAAQLQPNPAPGARELAEPSLREEMKDEIKF